MSDVHLLRNVVASPDTVAFTSPKTHRLLRNNNLLFVFTSFEFNMWDYFENTVLKTKFKNDSSEILNMYNIYK